MIKFRATKRWYRQAAKNEVDLEMTAGIQSVKPDPTCSANEVVIALTAIFLAGTLVLGIVQFMRFIAIYCKSSLC